MRRLTFPFWSAAPDADGREMSLAGGRVQTHQLREHLGAD